MKKNPSFAAQEKGGKSSAEEGLLGPANSNLSGRELDFSQALSSFLSTLILSKLTFTSTKSVPPVKLCISLLILSITAANFTFILEPFDRRAGRWWNKQLQKMSLSSSGTSLPLRVLSQIPLFYQRRYETESYFL